MIQRRIASIVLPIFCMFSLTGCKVDYSSNPYIGPNGSGYMASEGTTASGAAIAFKFNPDGTGRIGAITISNGNTKEAYADMTYTIKNDINVEFTSRDTNETLYGFFTTNAAYGQCFVYQGVYLVRQI